MMAGRVENRSGSKVERAAIKAGKKCPLTIDKRQCPRYHSHEIKDRMDYFWTWTYRA